MNTLRIKYAQASKQGGVAIITAMLLIALGTITMVAVISRQELDMHRERNEGIIQQARAFGVSGERFAAALLYRDVKAGLRGNTDSLDDDWAQTIPPVPIDNASIQGCIVDMQGRFNLNNLVDAEGKAAVLNVPNDDGVPVPTQYYFEQLKRLLGQLTIEQNKAQAILDWVDTDFDPTGAEGAEDGYYSSLTPGYRTANAPFISVSELQLVKGFSSAIKEESEDYEALLPHIAALPTDEPTAVNVNTATPEVLASMSEEIAPDAVGISRWDTGAYEDYPDCENIFDLAPEKELDAIGGKDGDLAPYESTLLFETRVAAGANGNDAAPKGTYGVRSNYFQVRIDVEAEGITLSQYTLFKRNEDGKTRVLYRSRDTL